MRIPRSPRELARAALDLAVVGMVLSGLVAVAARFFLDPDDAHTVFVVGFSVTLLASLALVVIAIVVKTIEVGTRPGD